MGDGEKEAPAGGDKQAPTKAAQKGRQGGKGGDKSGDKDGEASGDDEEGQGERKGKGKGKKECKSWEDVEDAIVDEMAKEFKKDGQFSDEDAENFARGAYDEQLKAEVNKARDSGDFSGEDGPQRFMDAVS